MRRVKGSISLRSLGRRRAAPRGKKHFPNGSEPLTFAGGAHTLTVDALAQQLQSLLANRAAVVAAQAAAKARVATEKDPLPALNARFAAFVALIRFRFGADLPVLADFGVAPRKVPAPLTAEQKAVAAARREATRQARGTRGAKQKSATSFDERIFPPDFAGFVELRAVA